MQGKSEPPELRGVIPNSFDHIFQNIKADPSTQFLVRCSYLEIYNEEIRDLLGDDTLAKLTLKEDPTRGVFVKDLKEVVVQDVVGINKVMDIGFENRTVGATLMNEGSSRSHSIFTVIVEANETSEDGKDHLRAGKLNLVDLAGSERQSKTGATGEFDLAPPPPPSSSIPLVPPFFLIVLLPTTSQMALQSALPSRLCESQEIGSRRVARSMYRFRHSATLFLRWSTGRENTFRTVTLSLPGCSRTLSVGTPRLSWWQRSALRIITLTRR